MSAVVDGGSRRVRGSTRKHTNVLRCGFLLRQVKYDREKERKLVRSYSKGFSPPNWYRRVRVHTVLFFIRSSVSSGIDAARRAINYLFIAPWFGGYAHCISLLRLLKRLMECNKVS